jgi:hypothetical protein
VNHIESSTGDNNMRAIQLDLPFQPRIAAGKRDKRITIACSDDFKTFVSSICRLTGENESELGHRYFLQGIKDDIGRIFMAEPHLDKKLSELLHKKF